MMPHLNVLFRCDRGGSGYYQPAKVEEEVDLMKQHSIATWLMIYFVVYIGKMKVCSISTAHTDGVCSVGINSNGTLLISGGEDGALCFTDLKSMQQVGRLKTKHAEAVTSVACSPNDQHTAVAASGTSVLHLDLRRDLGTNCVRTTYTYNEEEINSVAIDPTGAWIAAGDDSGQIQLIALESTSPYETPKPTRRSPYKTLRRGHSNICASVAFRPHRPSELISGGLDCRLVKWDWARLKVLQTWDTGSNTMQSAGLQICNPPMCHAVAVPQDGDRLYSRLVSVGRGDGCVALYDGDFRPALSGGASKSSGKSGNTSGKRATRSSGKELGVCELGQPSTSSTSQNNGLLWMSGPESGGHTTGVNTVCFVDGSGGRNIISAGNDRKLCFWDWTGEGGDRPRADLKWGNKINSMCCVGRSAGAQAVAGDVKGSILVVQLC